MVWDYCSFHFRRQLLGGLEVVIISLWVASGLELSPHKAAGSLASGAGWGWDAAR